MQLNASEIDDQYDSLPGYSMHQLGIMNLSVNFGGEGVAVNKQA
jgi:hypothetical protein